MKYSFIFSATRDNEQIISTVNSIIDSANNNEFEILIICDKEKSERLMKVIKNTNVFLISENSFIKNRRLNQGISRASGNMYVFTDDDILFPIHFLDNLKKLVSQSPAVDIFSGPMCNGELTQNSLTTRVNPWFGAMYSTTTTKLVIPEDSVWRYCWGGVQCIRPRVFHKYKQFFDEGIGPKKSILYTMGSEAELNRRLHLFGFNFLYSDQLKVHHNLNSKNETLVGTFLRGIRYGRSMRLERRLDVKQGLIDKSKDMKLAQIIPHLAHSTFNLFIKKPAIVECFKLGVCLGSLIEHIFRTNIQLEVVKPIKLIN